MFDVGFWELTLIGVVTLLVVGPERLPGIARTAGLWLGKARRVVAAARAEVERELRVEELRRNVQNPAGLGDLRDVTRQVQDLGRDLSSGVTGSSSPPGNTGSATHPGPGPTPTAPASPPEAGPAGERETR